MILSTNLADLFQADIWAFDIDGTLVNSFPAVFAAFNDYAYKEYGVQLSKSFVKNRIMVGTAEEIIHEFGDYLQTQYQSHLKGSTEEEVEKWLRAYKNCAVLPKAYPGAVELLLLGKKLGKKIPLITSGSQFEVLRNLKALALYQQKAGLTGDLYDTIVMWEDVIQANGSVQGKPNPLSMNIAMERMSVAKDARMSKFYVGDGWSDMLFGRNIDAMTVFLETSKPFKNIIPQLESYQPDIVLADIAVLYQYLNDFILNS